MKYIDRPLGSFVDIIKQDPSLEQVDVVMLTLDADNFLEKCLYSLYHQVPIRKLFVCDGGSKDKTLEILKKFPRVELHVRPDIRTTGKGLEFLFSLVRTDWFIVIDSDIEVLPGWYDEISSHRNYDVIESGKRIDAFHFYREDEKKIKDNSRPVDFCHLIKKNAVKNYHCDDDYNWRYTDYLLRQVVENSGFKYGKVSKIAHVHNETDRIPYKSDPEKNYQKIILSPPRWIITDKAKAKKFDIKHAKAIVKYLDPTHPLIKQNKGFDSSIRILDRNWVEKNGPKWLSRYDRARSYKFKIKNFLYRNLSLRL